MNVIDPRQLKNWSKQVESHLNELTREVNELRRFQASVDYERQVQAAQEFIERLQSNSVSYTNLILAAGYAGFFALWATLENDLPRWLHSLSAFLIVLSLLLFVAWEVTKMVGSAFHLRCFQQQLSAQPAGPDTIAKVQQALNEYDRRVGRLWVWFLIPTIVFGLAGGLCLLGFFTWRLYVTLI